MGSRIAQQGAAYSAGCSVLSRVQHSSVGRVQRSSVGRVQRRSVGSALACCMADPSLNLGLAPQGGFFPLSEQAVKIWREASINGDG